MKKTTLILIGVWVLFIGAASRYARQSGLMTDTAFTTQSAVSEESSDWDPRDYPCAEIKKKHNDACKEHFAEKARQNWVNADWSNAAALAAWVNNTCNDISDSYEMLCKWTNNLKYWLTVENLVCYEDCTLKWGIRAQMDSKIAGKQFVSPEEVEEFEQFMGMRMSKIKMQCAEQCNTNPAKSNDQRDIDLSVEDLIEVEKEIERFK